MLNNFNIGTIGLLAVLALPLVSGCVVRRGSDFGHWAAAAERIPLIRATEVPKEKMLTGRAKILLLPPMGEMPEQNKAKLFRAMQQDSQHYFPAKVFFTGNNGTLGEYLKDDNLILTGDILNVSEAGRIGQLLGATHVVCVQTLAFRPYPPMVMNLSISVIDTSTLTTLTEMHASFDAAEQTVVAAVAEYLQSRRSRKYDGQNLQIMLKSPSEYTSFVASRCTRELSRLLWARRDVTKVQQEAPQQER